MTCSNLTGLCNIDVLKTSHVTCSMPQNTDAWKKPFSNRRCWHQWVWFPLEKARKILHMFLWDLSSASAWGQNSTRKIWRGSHLQLRLSFGFCSTLFMPVSLYKLISLSQYCMLPWVFSTIVAVPGRDKRQNSIFGNCAPSCGNQIRLSDGCSGTLEVLSRGGLYGTATDRNFGVNEATVVCRQLGCLRNNIQPVRVNTREWVTI